MIRSISLGSIPDLAIVSLCRLDAKVGGRFVFCDVQGLDADVFLEVDIGGESFRGLFFIFEDLRQALLGRGQIVVCFKDADVGVHNSVRDFFLITKQSHRRSSTHSMGYSKEIVSLLYSPALDRER